MHPAKQKAQVRHFFAHHRVATTVQLERYRLLRGADMLDLPRVDLHVRTQAHQASSRTLLTFVAASEKWLHQGPRDLLHHALLAEAHILLRPLDVTRGMQWEYLDLKGRSGVWPDAQLLSSQGREADASVEVDTGYSPDICDRKILGAAADGYGTLIWATSVHGRVAKVADRMRYLQRAGQLGTVRNAVAIYVNVHTNDRNPYLPRLRLNKQSSIVTTFAEALTRATDA